MTAVRELRRQVGMTQTQLARVAGTSQPTIAAYESGRKSPTLQTLTRMARATGLDPVVSFVPAMTREDRRSLALHRAIADRLIAEPRSVLDRADRNLTLMWDRNPHARDLLTEWRAILSRPINAIVDAMVDPGVRARDLRQVTPFAGVLDASERKKVYQEFARRETPA